MLTAAVLGSVLVGALAQSVAGLGFALVCGPLLVALLGPYDGVRLAVVLSAALNLVLLVQLRRDVDRRRAVLLLLPSIVATPLLARLARGLPERPAAAAAGAVVLAATLLLALGVRWRAARGQAGMLAASVAGAATNVLAGVGGPPVVLWGENAGWSPAAQRATLQVYFLGTNLVAVPALGLPAVSPAVLLGCLAALAAGALAGRPVARRVSQDGVRRATLALAGAGGAAVLRIGAAGMTGGNGRRVPRVGAS